MKFLLQTILILHSIISFGQNINLKNFVVDSLPIGNQLYQANISKESWIIEKISDSIKVRKSDYNYIKSDSLPFSQNEVEKKLNNQHSIRTIKKVNDGYIIGLNGGEFGGGLWFLSTDGKSSYEIASYMRVRDIFEFNNKLYVIHGLSHLGSSSGSLLELKRDNTWQIYKTYKLPDAPNFIIKEDNNVLILTSEHLMNFNANEELSKILKAPFYWGMLYPSSAVIENNTIYIAMRKGILIISDFKLNPNYEWYIKK